MDYGILSTSPLPVQSNHDQNKTKQISNVADGPLDVTFEKLVKATLELWHVPGVAMR